MFLKKFLLFGLIAATLPAVAEEAADRKTATSLKYVEHELSTRQNKFDAEQNKAMEYTNSAGTVQKRAVKSDLGTSTTDTSLPMVGGVNTKLNQKQDDIDPVNDHTAVTYTGQPGGIGRKGIYQTTGTYTDQSDNLIDAKTFNAALKNGLDSEFVCREDNRDPVSGLCWLYTIHNGTAGNSLPDGYTELEFIQSSGSQYIDTGIYGNLNTKMEIDFALMATGGSNYAIYGAGIGQNSRSFTLCTNMGGTYLFPQFDTVERTVRSNLNFVLGQKYHIVHSKDGWYYDGTRGATWANPTEFTTPGTIWLFDENGSALASSSRIYYVKIYNNNELVFNGIPAKYGNDIGMYDTVSRSFKQNLGNGTFTAGPEINTTVYIPQNQ